MGNTVTPVSILWNKLHKHTSTNIKYNTMINSKSAKLARKPIMVIINLGIWV